MSCDKCQCTCPSVKEVFVSTDTIIKLGQTGKSFRCDNCGCNVFRRSETRTNVFKCNGCAIVFVGYEGEGEDE